jgi:hypothetical protein
MLFTCALVRSHPDSRKALGVLVFSSCKNLLVQYDNKKM